MKMKFKIQENKDLINKREYPRKQLKENNERERI